MDRAVDTANLGVTAAGHLSVWTLFINSSPVVKLVIAGLLLCSIVVWAVIFDKIVTIRRVNRAASDFEERFWAGGSLDGRRPDRCFGPGATWFS